MSIRKNTLNQYYDNHRNCRGCDRLGVGTKPLDMVEGNG